MPIVQVVLDISWSRLASPLLNDRHGWDA